MSNPQFLLQIVDQDGRIVHLPGGGPLEADLVEAIWQGVKARYATDRPDLKPDRVKSFIDTAWEAIQRRGVGLFCSEAHVEQDMKDAFREVLVAASAKDLLAYETTHADIIKEGIKDAILDLKAKTRFIV